MSKHSETLQNKKLKTSPTTTTCIVPNLLAFLARSIRCREGRPIATLLCRTRRRPRGLCSNTSPTVPKRPGGRKHNTLEITLDRRSKRFFFFKTPKKKISKTPKYSNHKKDPHQWCTTNPHPLTNATNVAPYSTTSARTMYLANRYFKNGVSVLRRTFDFFSFSPDDKRWSWWLV